ncbi:hypothetical protein [Thiohalobacter thiocyanaticus]|uniref:Uncharacterized protein n=1 Tax=Thiohalobacter thiocyanaticus TaxID=585455 RepID=A0A426QMB2_9GAMM|nr:hypothetical protein [Thiohalobacter thiocyanaticus]RRQ22904.1 hypothetical protein D6C00_13860 [Thiohalobacter thiocyanaticus]
MNEQLRGHCVKVDEASSFFDLTNAVSMELEQARQTLLVLTGNDDFASMSKQAVSALLWSISNNIERADALGDRLARIGTDLSEGDYGKGDSPADGAQATQ